MKSSEREMVQDALRAKIDPSAIVCRIEAEDETDTFGTVAYARDDDYHPFIVHRWATHDTAGEPIPDAPHFWAGWYGGDPTAWAHDFERRAKTSWD